MEAEVARFTASGALDSGKGASARSSKARPRATASTAFGVP